MAQDYFIDLAPNNNPIWVGHNDKEVDVAAFSFLGPHGKCFDAR